MTTPNKAYAGTTTPATPARVRGPIFASMKGVMGVEYPCGHFIPGPISGEAGARVKDAFARITPCPHCYPGGAAFIRRVSEGVLGGAR